MSDLQDRIRETIVILGSCSRGRWIYVMQKIALCTLMPILSFLDFSYLHL